MVRLAVPVVVVQVGMMFMGVVDTLMVGRVSAEALAAAAMGNLYYFVATIFGMGVLMALDPIVAQAVGAGDEPAIARGVQRGLVLAAVLALLVLALVWPAAWILTALHQPPAVVPVAAAFARITIMHVLPFYVFVVFRQTLQARHRVAPIVVTIVLANLVNLGLNWTFVFGHLGFTARGVVGSAWATVVSRYVMLAMLLAMTWREVRFAVRPWRRDTLDVPALGRMLAVGAPIGAQMVLEYGVFAVAGIMMGWLGTVEMAGHQVALNLASLTFMVPLGVSAAAAVLVGNAVGRLDAHEARRAAGAALLLGVSFMAASALTMLAIPWAFARAYTAEAAVIAVAVTLIPIAGVFQVFDGIQVVSIGILRGVADTRTPMLVNVLGFWLLGLPVCWWLGVRLHWGPAGVWWGLTLGLVVVAVFLVLRVRTKLSRPLVRLALDRPAAPGVPAAS